MGLIERIFGVVFGGERNVVRETIEVFRENAETGAVRSAKVQRQAMTQYGTEYNVARRGGFDRFMDGLNRLPRPALALGTLSLFVSAMVNPLWFSERMQGIALVPEPLWWLLGVIVSFYFGARHQVKAQDFQRETVVPCRGYLKSWRTLKPSGHCAQIALMWRILVQMRCSLWPVSNRKPTLR
jgi:hypothetical protein